MPLETNLHEPHPPSAAALTEAHAEAARRLASEGAAVEASGRDFESLLQRKTHEFNGAAGACVKALADVTQTRARGHVDALRGDFLAEADRTKMEVAKVRASARGPGLVQW